MRNMHKNRGERGFRPAGPDIEEFGPRHGGRGPRGRGPGGRRGGPGGRPRGDVRSAVLLLLAEQPRHGYDLIQAIGERSGGTWTPSPGSIYPTLQALEDEGLVTVERVDGRRIASLTPSGREWADDHAEEGAPLFESDTRTAAAVKIRTEMMALRDAAIHVARQPGDDQAGTAAKAAEILADARRRLYGLLAE